MKTVAYLRVSTAQQDVRSQRLAILSERTREGLARARSSGRKLGRPKGSLGVSRLDGKEDEIRRFLELGVSKTAIRQDHGRVQGLPARCHLRAAEPLVQEALKELPTTVARSDLRRSSP